jgi:hypothetical protein
MIALGAFLFTPRFIDLEKEKIKAVLLGCGS